MCLTLEDTDENYAVDDLHQSDQVMQYRYTKMSNCGAPTHENAHLWSTVSRQRPITEYQRMKTPNEY